MGKHTPLSSRERVTRHRASMRAKGFRLRQVWVPDVDAPGFNEEVRRQWADIAAAEDHKDVEELIAGVIAQTLEGIEASER